MDDLLRNLALSFFGLLALHGSLEKRARHDAARQVREAFQDSGTIRAGVEPGGVFGVFANNLQAVDIYGAHFHADRLPFVVAPRAGWKGTIHHLRLHFTDFSLSGLPVARLEADIPSVTYDIGHALYRDRLVLRGAGIGPAVVVVKTEGLTTYINKKFKHTLSDVIVWTQNQKIYISGRINLFAGPSDFIATGILAPRENLYLDLAAPEIRMNGTILPSRTAGGVMLQINPVVDLRHDLHLEGFFVLSEAEIGDGVVILRGKATVPLPRKPELP
jgi:hypothetical protein